MALQLKSIDAEAPFIFIKYTFFEGSLNSLKYFYRKLDKKRLIF